MFWIFILLYLILLNCGSFIPERAESSQDWHSSRLSCVRASFVQGRSPGASETLHPAPGRGFLSGLSSDIFSVHRAIRLETESQDGGFVQLLWCSTLFLFVFWWQVNQVSIKNTDAKRKRERERERNSPTSLWRVIVLILESGVENWWLSLKDESMSGSCSHN